MNRYLKGIFLYIFVFSASVALAQQKAQETDSLHNDSIHVTESILIRQQQQGHLDSLLKLQIQEELKGVVGNQAKTEELRARLIAINKADSVRRLQQKKKIDELKKDNKGYPVVLLNDTLFNVFVRVGSFKAKDRAESISKKIETLYQDPFFKADSLKVLQNEESVDIIYNKELVVMSISDLDALWFDKTPLIVATEYLNTIKSQIVLKKKENSVINWVKKIAIALAIILGLTLLISIVNKLFKKGENYFEIKNQQLFEFLTSKQIKIFSPDQIKSFILKAYNTVRILVVILIIYLSLPLLFSIFPQTKNLTGQLIQWILTPLFTSLNAIVGFLPNLITIIVIYFIFKYAIKALRYFVVEISRGNIQISGFHQDWANPTFNILKVVLYAFMLVIIWPYLPGSDSAAFQGVSVFLGILISLGSSSAITNMVAGLVITYMRPFKIGDRVKIGEHVGDVVEKTMLVTRIKTIKNEDITVPNSAVLSGSTINYSANCNKEASPGLIVHTTITIGYDVPWKTLYEVLIKAALKTDLVEQTPSPFVLQTGLEDFYVAYQINAYTKHASKQALIYSSLHQNIQDACNEAGIEIMSPHYRAARDGSTTTIPESYLPKDYQAPPFNVKIQGQGKTD
ncbi:mechanosensitive ion channel family protein [Pedobacter arcticus]|uniref:mechanosensitive ion channel family protein n=1 Tax=Pedobacter arcticus TaxID=752140 RepID=UPI0002FC5206|nr:mechanosensitive ion channel family protein [Pedobacter arcticus]